MAWLAARHEAGATISSACSGIFLIAETGLFDGQDATVHWPCARAFASLYPAVRAHPEPALVVAGRRGELVSSGASISWHDLVLHLIGREAGPVASQLVSKAFALQNHVDGLAPFIVFDPPRDHGDALIAETLEWLDIHAAVAAPVREAMVGSGLSDLGFARRFRAATGHAPLDYLQRVRVEQANRRLERTDASVEEISLQVRADLVGRIPLLKSGLATPSQVGFEPLPNLSRPGSFAVAASALGQRPMPGVAAAPCPGPLAGRCRRVLSRKKIGFLRNTRMVGEQGRSRSLVGDQSRGQPARESSSQGCDLGLASASDNRGALGRWAKRHAGDPLIYRAAENASADVEGPSRDLADRPLRDERNHLRWSQETVLDDGRHRADLADAHDHRVRLHSELEKRGVQLARLKRRSIGCGFGDDRQLQRVPIGSDPVRKTRYNVELTRAAAA